MIKEQDFALDGAPAVENMLPLFILGTSLDIEDSSDNQHLSLIWFSKHLLSFLAFQQANFSFLLHVFLLGSLIFCEDNHPSVGTIRGYVPQAMTLVSSPTGIMTRWGFVLWTWGFGAI